MRLVTLKNSFIRNMGTLGPTGRIGRAPGTNGSIAGVLSYPMLGQDHSAIVFLPLFFLAILLAIRICSQCEKILRRRDPSCVVIDEFLAMILCLWLAERGTLYCHVPMIPRPVFFLVGFLFFRIFDIFKPLGINALQKLPGGLGIILDDLLAAIYAAGLLLMLNVLCY